MEPVGIFKSSFPDKFGIPRQSGLSKIPGTVELGEDPQFIEAVKELETFTHIWLIYKFHEIPEGKWKGRIRPPRLGGNQSVGVFASRSPFRPNPIGLSAVELAGVRKKSGKIYIDVFGADIVNNTPILDIKPYIPYADCITEAGYGWLEGHSIPDIPVEFSSAAKETIKNSRIKKLKSYIIDILAQDPRPAYKKENDQKVYSLRLFDYEIKFKVQTCCQVLSIEKFER